MRGLILVLLLACKVKEPPPVRDPFADKFERLELGSNYLPTGDGYRITKGVLSAKGAHNHPLWLTRRIPRDVKIELDTWSTEPRGDLKIELFGDGHSFDPDGGAYTATGYELIFGGWYNTKSIIARLDEHGHDMVQRTDIKVEPNKVYHWRIERKGKTLKWFITDRSDAQAPPATPVPTPVPFLVYEDPKPLEGAGHDYLGFNNWETDTWFDNLVITPL